ncbi:uncharacterized protein LOC126615516 [Malus sylvestris]|uniref:uncharacterized protein LOC126615516 n=1 Tax=Malus sylvestris TaxID=3752 RepID=UPI0021AC8C18|nr:uncharacterized protein LOC126615516 [Malus sylvestris]
MTFNMHIGYLEAIVRGHRSSLFIYADYNKLCQCKTLDDIKTHISATIYSPTLPLQMMSLMSGTTAFAISSTSSSAKVSTLSSLGDIEEAIKLIRLEEDIQVDIWVLVESGHDVDAADLRVQFSSAAVFLSLSRRI